MLTSASWRVKHAAICVRSKGKSPPPPPGRPSPTHRRRQASRFTPAPLMSRQLLPRQTCRTVSCDAVIAEHTGAQVSFGGQEEIWRRRAMALWARPGHPGWWIVEQPAVVTPVPSDRATSPEFGAHTSTSCFDSGQYSSPFIDQHMDTRLPRYLPCPHDAVLGKGMLTYSMQSGIVVACRVSYVHMKINASKHTFPSATSDVWRCLQALLVPVGVSLIHTTYSLPIGDHMNSNHSWACHPTSSEVRNPVSSFPLFCSLRG